MYALHKDYPEYRPDQPRGEDGKWTGGGGSAGSQLRRGTEAQDLLARNLKGHPTPTRAAFLRSLKPEQRAFLQANARRLKGKKATHELYQNPDGTWKKARRRLHDQIIQTRLKDAMERAKPAEGEKPKLVIVGGRPASGKTTSLLQSGFVPNMENYLYVNADDIRGDNKLFPDNAAYGLPGYEGWNSTLYHKEASMLAARLERAGRDLGLNIVHDATLRDVGASKQLIQSFQDEGYYVTGIYVHARPEVTAMRAIDRGMGGPRARFVPSYILGTAVNERAFDAIKGNMDEWQLYDVNTFPGKRVATGKRTRRTRKGYPEYNAGQERGEDGKWTGGGGGSGSASALDTSSAAGIKTTLKQRLGPYYLVEVQEFGGGYDVKAGDGSANFMQFFLPRQPGNPLTLEMVNSNNDEGARMFARNALQAVVDAARDTKASAIRLQAEGVGGYVWPKIGFELNPKPLGELDVDPVQWFLENSDLQRRLQAARDIMGFSERRQFNNMLREGGLDLPAKIAALDRVLTPAEFSAVSRDNRFLPTTGRLGRLTLGKALLVGVKGFYTLPSTKFGVLENYARRTGKAAHKAVSFLRVLGAQGFAKNPYYRPDQARGEDGKWVDEGGGGRGSRAAGIHLPAGKEASALYQRNVEREGAISPEDFVARLPQDQRDFLSNSQRKLDEEYSQFGSTEDRYRVKNEDGSYGAWNPDRQRLHQQIIAKFIDEAVEKDAFPDEGEKPTVVLMGGRGGAGKTSTIEKFLGINPEKHPEFMYINSDDIKGMLPEYKGYNASLVHEESSYIADSIESIARQLGINVIYDATLKSENSAVKRAQEYRDAGYRVEAFFVHTTPQTSATRATGRAVRTGRYVTPAYILGSTTNERAFDSIKSSSDAWMLFDNNGSAPKKIASRGRTYLK